MNKQVYQKCLSHIKKEYKGRDSKKEGTNSNVRCTIRVLSV